MPRVLVIHYDAAECERLAERVRREGVDAQAYEFRGSKGFRWIRENPPDAILISLLQMPSYGRWIGVSLREHKVTREIPLVFVAGDPEKSAIVKRVLPGAAFGSLDKIGAAVQTALRRKKAQGLNYAGHPAAAKLGIEDGAKVAMLRAPDGFTLNGMPKTARVKGVESADTVLTFSASTASLAREVRRVASWVEAGKRVWILWKKKAAQPGSDLSPVRIIEMLAPAGLVGYKTCAVDETWSAIAVSRSRRKRGSFSAVS